MLTRELVISGIPEYLKELLLDSDSELYKEQIRQKEYSFAAPLYPGERHVFIPWSGGLDSTASLLMAIESGVKVTTVNFNYGQSYYAKETSVIKTLKKDIQRKYPDNLWEEHYSIDISWLDQKMKDHFKGSWGHIFPARNYILLSEVLQLAKKFAYSEIWFSCVQGEIAFSGGDKSIVFLNEMQRKCIDSGVLLLMPHIGLGKSDIVHWAKSVNARYGIIRKTISCFSGSENTHCGACMSCFNRAVGFYAAHKIEDAGFIPRMEKLANWIEYYRGRVVGSNPYSMTKKQAILDFISSLEGI